MVGAVEGTGTTTAWDVRRILEPPCTLPGALTTRATEFGDTVAVEGPDGFPEPTLVVRTNEREGGIRVTSDLGWSAWVDGEVTVLDVDAAHLDLLRAPVVDDLGPRLRAAFTAAVTPGARP